MKSFTRNTLLSTALCLVPSIARAQFAIDWYTIDNNGGGQSSSGEFSITGTIAQHDAGSPAAAGNFEVAGGFWVSAAAPCYLNCDGSSAAPHLNANDFICFLTRYAANDPYANCDESTTAPLLNANDFICFMTRYVGGCP